MVEWRALTVALLDRLAGIVREKLDMNAETLPLAKVLEGGTWAAGRAIARDKRPDGAPPITVISDGTVFYQGEISWKASPSSAIRWFSTS